MQTIKRISLILFIVFSIITNGHAATFVVTSNADSGPGTLRDALTQAAVNGTTEKDFITFNIADQSEAGRTITITTALPFLSSNLVIDGTTQPGTKLGVSDAKIILQPIDQNTRFNALVAFNVDTFELYGLYIRDFLGRDPSASTIVGHVGFSAIYIETSSNMQIGAPGKGNVLSNNGHVIYTNDISITDGVTATASGVNNIKVYSNLIGVEPDGRTLRGDVNWGIDLSYCKGHIEIGGSDIGQRNIFNNCARVIGEYFLGGDNYYSNGSKLFPADFLIENNYVGYDVSGNPLKIPDPATYQLNAVIFDIYEFPSANPNYYDCPYTFQILNNKFQYPYSVTAAKTTGPINFQGNKMLYEPSVAPFQEVYLAGVTFRSNDNINVGGEADNESNTIDGALLGLYTQKSLLIQHNSIYCVNNPEVWRSIARFEIDPDMPLPVVSINNITATSVSGKATPLSKIELFWDDDCRYCQPMTYITTVNTDANGNWSYTGTIQKGIVASATLNGFTSFFTMAATLYGGGNITHYACGNKGKITGDVFTNTGGYLWKNANGETIGTDGNIDGLDPGIYTLSALNGTCSTTYTFTVFDATPKIDDSQKKVVNVACGNATGSISGIYLDNYDVISDAESRGDYNVYGYQWLDAANNVVSTDLVAENLQAGTYRLKVSYKDICTVTYGPVEVANTTGPSIDQTDANASPANCGQSNGSISGVKVTGTGIITYI